MNSIMKELQPSSPSAVEVLPRHATMERLAYLDQCFEWRGYANRRDLIAKFGISPTQAVFDFRKYFEWCRDPLPAYDRKLKAYVAADLHVGLPEFFERFPTNSIIADGASDRFESVPMPSQFCPQVVIRNLFLAMQYNRRIEVAYLSIASGDKVSQWIVPVRIASDGDRLHFRCWSYQQEEWQDFIPARIAESSSFASEPLDAPLPRDDEWETRVSVEYRLKSGLSAEQQRAAREECGMIGDSVILETNQALVPYLDRRMGVDSQDASVVRHAAEVLVETSNLQ